MTKKFNDFRFEGLNYRKQSNKYVTMDRVSSDEKKIVVKTSPEHLLQTKYGYALILNNSHVVFLKSWQVDDNWYGIEVLLTEDYWNVKEWGDFSDHFDNSEEDLKFSRWLHAAKKQRDSVDQDGIHNNMVRWTK